MVDGRRDTPPGIEAVAEDSLARKRLAYYLRLDYPRDVVGTTAGYVGTYPDIPEVSASDANLVRLYAELDRARREWITARIDQGLPVPLPNSSRPTDGEVTPAAP